MQNHWRFSSNNIYFCKCQKADEKKKKKLRRASKPWKRIKFGSSPFASKMSVNTNQFNTFNKLNCSCFHHIINILLTELSRSVWENLDLGRVYRPHCVRFVLTTAVKILPYRPPARLIRANYSPIWLFLAHDLVEDRSTIDVTITNFFPLCFKTAESFESLDNIFSD